MKLETTTKTIRLCITFQFCGWMVNVKATVSWLIVPRGFSGHHVFHNDMEQSLDMRARGHPGLSLLIPDSSFSLDSTSFNYQTGVWVLLDKSESQGTWTFVHSRTNSRQLIHRGTELFVSCSTWYMKVLPVILLICCLSLFNNSSFFFF